MYVQIIITGGLQRRGLHNREIRWGFGLNWIRTNLTSLTTTAARLCWSRFTPRLTISAHPRVRRVRAGYRVCPDASFPAFSAALFSTSTRAAQRPVLCVYCAKYHMFGACDICMCS